MQQMYVIMVQNDEKSQSISEERELTTHFTMTCKIQWILNKL